MKNTLNLHVSRSRNSDDFYRISVGRNRRVSDTRSICFTGDLPAESLERTIAVIASRYCSELDTPTPRELVVTTDMKPNPHVLDDLADAEIGDRVVVRESIVPYDILDGISVRFNTPIRTATYRIKR